MPSDPSLPPELTRAVSSEPAPRRRSVVVSVGLVALATLMFFVLLSFVAALGGNEY